MISFDGIRTIGVTDSAFAEAKQLRFSVLFQPFGVSAFRDFDDGNPDSRHLAYFQGGRVVGYGRLVMSGDEAQIRHLCVASSAQGQGIGSALLKELIDLARKDRARVVFLNARFTAMGMYRHFGFKEVGGLMPADDVAVPHKRMELAL